MANDNETVREVCAEMNENSFDNPYLNRDGIIGVRILAKDWAKRILSAHEREMAAIVRNLDALEIAVEENCDKATVEKIIANKRNAQTVMAAKDAEIARLKAALNRLYSVAKNRMPSIPTLDEVEVLLDAQLIAKEGGEK